MTKVRHNGTGVDTSILAKMVDFGSLNLETDKLDIAKLETSPIDLKRSNWCSR